MYRGPQTFRFLCSFPVLCDLKKFVPASRTIGFGTHLLRVFPSYKNSKFLKMSTDMLTFSRWEKPIINFSIINVLIMDKLLQ
jgi:hypothetical protein